MGKVGGRIVRLSAVAALGCAAWLGIGGASSWERRGAQPEGIVGGRVADTESLRALLESLGYDPQDIGQGNWRIMRKSGEWELGIDLQLTGDGSTVWVRCFIGTLEQAEEYRASHYLGLLEMQGRVSPRFFFTTAVEGGLGLFFCRGLDNRALTAEIIDAEIAALQDTLAGNVALWNYTGWERAEGR